MIRKRQVHYHQTREKKINFAHGNTSNASKKLPFQARVKFTNKLPEIINSTLNKNIFETRLRISWCLFIH